MDGPFALPRMNGELVFETPWEGRAFGIAIAISQTQGYEWDDFRNLLITEIQSAEKSSTASTYYESWLSALEKLAISKGLVSLGSIDTRTTEYRSGERQDDF